MTDIILQLDKITKVYENGTIANQDVSIDFRKGEIHSVVGENGAGKSTIMKVVFGIEHASSGTITYKGNEVRFSNSMEAIKNGIGMVHQHFMLIPSFTVAQNIVLGNEPRKGIFLDKKAAIEKTQAIAKQYNFDIDVTTKVENLSVGAKQKVEILKTLYQNAEIIILDEPTAVLTPQETEQLFEELMRFKEQGHTIVFISHKLNEVKQISDRITVMRNGKSFGTFDNQDISLEKLTELIVGRELSFNFDDLKHVTTSKDVLLAVEGLNLKGAHKAILSDINLCVKSGEILGIAGVQGNGQSELIKCIVGLDKADLGNVKLIDRDVTKMVIKQRRDQGLAYIPEDRMVDGVAVGANISDIIISSYVNRSDMSGKVFLRSKAIAENADNLIKKFSIKTKNRKAKIESLSGGNIQKVVVAREYATKPKILIAEQPTRGIDIGSANFIHKELITLRNEGFGILLVSADLNEVMELSDRLIVMHDGEIVAYFPQAKGVSDHELGLYMLGVKKMGEAEVKEIMHV